MPYACLLNNNNNNIIKNCENGQHTKAARFVKVILLIPFFFLCYCYYYYYTIFKYPSHTKIAHFLCHFIFGTKENDDERM